MKEGTDRKEDQHCSEFSTRVKRSEGLAVATKRAQGDTEIPAQREGTSSHKRFLNGVSGKLQDHRGGNPYNCLQGNVC